MSIPINDSTTGIKFVYEQLNAHSENIKVCLPFNLVSSRFIINAYEPRQSVQKKKPKISAVSTQALILPLNSLAWREFGGQCVGRKVREYSV